MRLGAKQLGLLKALGTSSALVVANRESRRLCELGLLTAEPDGSFARVTPTGLRALADAADAGLIMLFTLRGEA